MKFKITLLLLLSLYTGFAQVTNQGKPLSWKLDNLEKVDAIEMPAFDLAALQAEDKANEMRKDMPWRFGHEFFVDHNLNNSGSWHTLPNGDRIWRIRYRSEGAKTLNFLFSDFYMPADAKVYLYNDARTDLLGAYDAKQNNEQRVIGTWLVQGQDIWIEYYEPAAVRGQGKLEILKVVHGYRTSDGMLKSPDDDINSSGNCNYDVDCALGDIDDLKDINKKAVGLIIAGNSGFCTGTLVNNTNNDGTPYFLTANHCYDTPSQWAFRFNWISPNPVCAANTNSTNNAPNYYQTTSGATLRARNGATDFCLVEITADIPADWDLVYAGWDRSDEAPESTFGIHHPAGDIMKACKDDDAPTAEIDNEGVYLWVVGNWELGVTEGGSSGSALFSNEGRIIGQLFYGGAACIGTSNNGEYDAYGRFGISWNNATVASGRLSDWLDPLGTEALTLDYYPPVEVYAVDARVAITTLGQDLCSNTITPAIRVDNRGTETLTAATITYTFNGVATVVNWTGALATGESYALQLADLEGVNGDNVFTVVITNPNNGVDGNVNNNTVTNEFVIEEVAAYQPGTLNFEFASDNFAYETTWELTDDAGEVLYSGGPYFSLQPVTDSETFTLAEGCYTFTMYDDAGDGICCDWGEGSFSLTTEDGATVAEAGEFGSASTTRFIISNSASVNGNALKNALKVYPNPSAGIYNVSIPATYQNVSYNVYNVVGQNVRSGKITAAGTININHAANGVYMLKVTDDASGATATFKLIKE